MIGVLAFLPALFASVPTALGDAPPAPRELAVGGGVSDVMVAQVDGDGIADLLLLDGRTVRIWRGRKGALPAEAPTWTVTLNDGVDFVDALPGAKPALLTLGTQGARRRPLGSGAESTLVAHTSALTWRDPDGAHFARLTQPQGLLLPQPDGWWLQPAAGASAGGIRMPIPRHREVSAPGPFLEDTSSVLQALPWAFVGRAPTAKERGTGLWALDGRRLIGQSLTRRVTYDLAFLDGGGGGAFEQRLLDLDGDERPDVMHRIYTNRDVRYGFFHTQPAADGAATGPSHRPATSTLFLSGFQLDPEFVDLDGDGLKDLVVTSMQVNIANMIGALRTGRVTAETRAFLNRWKQGGGTFFDDKPTAVVKSQIGVKVQFNYVGNIEVIRSFTILVDGDFDGDGRRDLAIRTAPDEITIHRGTASGVWAGPKERIRIAIPPKAASPDIDGYVADLDGDGRDELILLYRKTPGGRDRLWIVDPGL